MSDTSVVFVGVSIVFICMIIITLLLYAFPLIFRGKDHKKKKDGKAENDSIEEAPASAPEPAVLQTEKDDQELIAVISAAVSAYLGADSQGRFRVKSFRRVGDNAAAWSRTARLENLTE